MDTLTTKHLSRRTLGRGAIGLAAAAVVGTGVAQPALAQTEVSMKLLLLAAQLDPPRSGTAQTPDAGPSVTAVEQALAAAGRLDDAHVDGHYGTATISAYAAHQKALGYSGLAANGVPGTASLKALGEGRFTIVEPVDVGPKVTVEGHTLNTRTRDMLEAARAAVGFSTSLTQGSYSSDVGASAGTHDGGGAIDIGGAALSGEQRQQLCRALRDVGFAAWVRSPSQGNWGWHLHGIAICDPDLSSGARNQVADYYAGRNGLANGAADDGPQVPKVIWEDVRG